MSVQTHPIYQDLIEGNLDLENIYLDPNNPRFVSLDWKYIQDDHIEDDDLQDSILNKLSRNYNVDSLLMNMEVNGYLPIDRVIVKEFSDGKYYVLEGNRRIAAAKRLLKKKGVENTDISDAVFKSLDSIPVLIYTGDDDEASWIFQGLRHIMGVKDWSAYNKAKLLVKLMEEEDLNLTSVGRRFGITAFGAGQWARGYYALMQAREESDYNREIDERAFPFFQELFNRSNAPLREWLSWSNSEEKFTDDFKFNEFLGWLYPREVDEYDENEDTSDIIGDWGKRKIKTAQSLRSLSYIIRKTPKEFENFRNEEDLEISYNRAIQSEYEEQAKKKLDSFEETIDDLDICIKSLSNLPFTIFKNETQFNQIEDRIKKLSAKIEEILSFKNG